MEIWQWSVTNPQEGLSFTKIHLLFYICSHSKRSHLRNKIDTNTVAVHFESGNYPGPRQMSFKKSETGNPESRCFGRPF